MEHQATESLSASHQSISFTLSKSLNKADFGKILLRFELFEKINGNQLIIVNGIQMLTVWSLP